MAKTHRFTIPIGDWSGDGHSRCDWYEFTSNKPLDDVREAYFEAVKKGLAPSPEDFCCEYEDYEVPEEVIEEAKKLGYTIDPDDFGPEDMADYIAWFITLADGDLKLKRQKNLSMLPFYGYDSKKRHIGFFGYGLLGS